MAPTARHNQLQGADASSLSKLLKILGDHRGGEGRERCYNIAGLDSLQILEALIEVVGSELLPAC